MGGRDVKKTCDSVSGQRSNQAGNQRRVVQQAYADDCHGEDGGRKRGSEQRGKEGCHSGNRHSAEIAVVQMQKLAYFKTDRSAHLQGGAFAAGGAAAEMCEQG